MSAPNDAKLRANLARMLDAYAADACETQRVAHAGRRRSPRTFRYAPSEFHSSAVRVLGYGSSEDVARVIHSHELTAYLGTVRRELMTRIETIDHARAREIAAFYGDRTGEGSGALRYFARTGIIGRGLRIYLSSDLDAMPPRLAQLATYVRADARERTTKTLRVLSIRFTIEDDGDGGSMAVYREVEDGTGCPVAYDDKVIDCTPDAYDREDGLTAVDLAVRALRDCGATEHAGSWWSDPDGSQIVDYGTGEREETSAHPSGAWTAGELSAIDA